VGARSRQARFCTLCDSLQGKDIIVEEGRRQRFVMVHNLQAAERDVYTRDRLIALLASRIDGCDEPDPGARAGLRGRI